MSYFKRKAIGNVYRINRIFNTTLIHYSTLNISIIILSLTPFILCKLTETCKIFLFFIFIFLLKLSLNKCTLQLLTYLPLFCSFNCVVWPKCIEMQTLQISFNTSSRIIEYLKIYSFSSMYFKFKKRRFRFEYIL